MKALKNVLLVNGLTSGATGLLLIVFTDFFAALFASDAPAAFLATGVFLVLFAGLVLSQARTAVPREKMVALISVMDMCWVLASMVIVVFQFFSLSLPGYLLISGVAAWVALMAVLQLRGLRRIPV